MTTTTYHAAQLVDAYNAGHHDGREHEANRWARALWNAIENPAPESGSLYSYLTTMAAEYRDQAIEPRTHDIADLIEYAQAAAKRDAYRDALRVLDIAEQSLARIHCHPLTMASIAEAVPETEEPPLCHCGRHYQGAPCPERSTTP